MAINYTGPCKICKEGNKAFMVGQERFLKKENWDFYPKNCKNQNIYSLKSIVDDGLQCASAHHLTSKEGIAVGLECTRGL